MIPRAAMLALVVLSALLLSAPPGAGASTDESSWCVPYEKAWSDLLGRVVTDAGLVRYDLLAGPLRDEFDAVAAAIEAFDASTLDTFSEKLTFWVNAYNVKIVKRVLEAGVPENIEDYGFAFFFETPVRVAGYDVTLNQIEHLILRRQDGPVELEALAVNRLDPRLHVGLNCGAISCPRLRAFTVANVDAELDAAMRDFVNSPQHFRFEGDTAALSSLLDWFAADWDVMGPDEAGDYLLGFMDSDRPDANRLRRLFEGQSAAEIRALPNVRFAYDWDLNAADG